MGRTRVTDYGIKGQKTEPAAAGFDGILTAAKIFRHLGQAKVFKFFVIWGRQSERKRKRQLAKAARQGEVKEPKSKSKVKTAKVMSQSQEPQSRKSESVKRAEVSGKTSKTSKTKKQP